MSIHVLSIDSGGGNGRIECRTLIIVSPWFPTVLAWLLVFASPGNFATQCDRFKVFYARRTWARATPR